MKIIKKYQGTVPDNKIMNTYSSSQTDTYSSDYENKHFVTKKFIKVRATQNQGLTTAGNMTVLFQNVDTNIGDAFQLVNNRVQIIDPTITMVKVTLTAWIELGNNSYAWCHIGTQNASWNNWKEFSTYMQPPTTQVWHTTTQVALCPIDATNNFISPIIFFNNASNDNMVRGGTYSNSVYMIVEAMD